VPHIVPQAPQLFGSVSVFVQTPGRQAVRPVLHVMPHVLFVHVAVPPCAGQTLLQLPQLLGSVAVFTSQPLLRFPSQLAKPALHMMPHVLFEHVAVPFCAGQTLPQRPQLFGSFWVLTHAFPQAVWPDGQVSVQMPAVQLSPAGHAVPQAPQLFESVCRFVQIALAPVPQAFGIAEGQTHVPPEQIWDVPHGLLQAPQFVVLVSMFVSQPFEVISSQLAKPLLHVAIAHWPFEQVAVAFVRLQTLPQAPQLFTSPLVFVPQTVPPAQVE
jgi:hypothetical protein